MVVDLEYYRKRMEAEAISAIEASSEPAATAHQRLANAYAELLESLQYAVASRPHGSNG